MLTDIYLDSGKADALIKAAKSANVSHAYLFCGADEATLDAAAKIFMAAAVCKGANPPCTACPECKKALSGNAADIINIKRSDGESNILRVEEVAEIIGQAYLTAFELKYKFICIAEAQMLNEAAQNKLLKILEEPNPDTVFILKADNDAKLLATIRSRVRTVRVMPPEQGDIEKYLVKTGCDADKARIYASLCGGSVRRAEQFAADGSAIGAFNNALEMLSGLSGSKEILLYAGKAAREKNFPLYLESIRLILREAQCLSAGVSELITARGREETIAKVAANYPNNAPAAAVDCVTDAEKRVQANCGQASIADNLLFSLMEVRSKCQK